jgi:endonuclease III
LLFNSRGGSKAAEATEVFMKDSKDYSKKVHKLYRSLKRKCPEVQKAVYDEPVDALVYAIISAELSEAAAQFAIKRISDCFVDWNELRISRTEEVVEALGANTSVTRDMASALTSALRVVFSKYNMVSLKALCKMSKRQAKGVLEKIEGTSRFAVGYCMLTSLQGHAIPLTKKMIEYLRSNELVHAGADEEEIEGFLARQISAENAYEFYSLLRCESEAHEARGKKKTARKEKEKVKK